MPRMYIVTVIRSPTPTLQPRAPEITTTSDRPYFPEPSTLVPPQKEPDDGSGTSTTRNTLVKSVFEYTLLAVAVVILSCLVIRRLSRLKRTNQPLRNFFSCTRASEPSSAPQRNFPRTTGLPSLRSLPFYPSAAYNPQDRRVRGQGTDTHGRRLGTPGGEYDYDHDDKDLLPAYDTAGGPPKYIDVELGFLSASSARDGRAGGLGAGVGAGARSVGGVLGRGVGRRGDDIPPAHVPGLAVEPPLGSPPPGAVASPTIHSADPGTRATSPTTPPPVATDASVTTTTPPPRVSG